MQYEAVIGLEIHAELKTKTKMFCFSPNDPNEKHPNINICPICMGHPGTLPTINEDAVKKVIMVGLALNAEIPEFSQFDRKSYFYPDLPKGYQISQYEHPLVEHGILEIKGKKIRITRVHLEEDTGRIIHDKEDKSALIDYNRAGVPLMELVTEPDFRTGEEIKEFGESLRQIVRYIGASDADMEKGQMRVEVNISMRPLGEEKFGTKVEIKNINSFKFAKDAAEYEMKRQSELLDRGEKVIQETRGWNEFKQETFSQRIKEGAHDYRYLPEPDLPPLAISREFVEGLRALLPELPQAKSKRFQVQYGLLPDIADIIVSDKSLGDYFEEVTSELLEYEEDKPEKSKKNLPKLAASYITGELQYIMREHELSVTDIRVTPENFAELMSYIAEEKLSNQAAKEVLLEMVKSGDDPSDVIDRMSLWQMSGAGDLEDIARHIIEENPKTVEDFRKGKQASLQFLLGQVMKESRGKANPKIAMEAIKKLLGSEG